jgi:predicted dehydrogenase
MAKHYRWGILGPGRIAHAFANALSVTEHGQLYGVASRKIERAIDFAKEFGAQKSYDSYQALIEDRDIDIVYIATPHHLHYPLSKSCIENGKHVLCEKPITINSRQFITLSHLAHKKNVFYMDALWTRFLPSIKKTLELLKEIGPVISIRADFGFKGAFSHESRLFNPALGGGSLLDIGIYPVFIVLLILGKPSRILTSAKIGETGVDESMAAIFAYDNGALANISSTFMADTQTEVEIACDKGTILIHPKFHMPSSVELQIRGKKTEIYEFTYHMNGYEYEAEEVMACLDKGLIESPKLNHEFTKILMETMDEIRVKNNLSYGDIELL